MLNNQSVFFGGKTSNINNVKVNAVSGGIVKNHAKSFFLRFNLKSDVAGTLLSPQPYRKRKATYNEIEEHRKTHYSKITHIDVPVEVLQLVVVGDMEVVAEVIDIEQIGIGE